MYFYIQCHTIILKIIVIIVTICFLYFRKGLHKMSSESRKRRVDEKSENTSPQCSFGELMESTCHCKLNPQKKTKKNTCLH